MREKDLCEMLDWQDGTEEYTELFLRKVADYESVVIFGAGIGGKTTLDLLSLHNSTSKVKAFCDNNSDKIGKKYCGYQIISPDVLKDCIEGTLIIVSSTAYDLICQQLMSIGVEKENIYYFQPAGVSLKQDGDFSFVKRNIYKFDKVYHMLMDETSKLIYRNLINYRLTKNSIWLEQMKEVVRTEEEQYFDKELLASYSFDSGFIDAGAYVGDTMYNFFKFYPNWKGIYYCFEASPDIYAKLREHVKGMDDSKVKTYNYAVWSCGGVLNLDVSSEENGGSKISDCGVEVNCEALDNILKNVPIDFIKMDIEGVEHDALIGAQEIIKKNKPILTICIYHKPEDFYDIPLLIEELLPMEYEYYIRQYRYGLSETVLYALPQSRHIT